ncbi:MAG: hypothetical protein M3Y27_09135 [Acidobacteriota bacterium]|nr:hypothetical protein [Acidobacteriota bacterium]
MTLPFRILLVVLIASVAQSHPMGNFSVSHYTRIEVKARAVDIIYVLDLAELPTFDLFRQWGLERTSPPADLQRKTVEQARTWAGNLMILSDGRPVKPKFVKADLVVADGAGDLPIARITSHLRLDVAPGKLEYEDRNFAERAGWKEIVIRAAPGVTLDHASQGSQERSNALTQYPQDPMVAPPQDLRAALEWTSPAPVFVAEKPKAAPVPVSVITPIPQPHVAPLPSAPATTTAAAAPAGTVVRGDYLSRLLHQRELTMNMMIIAVLVAFVLGAAHALTPGHGKTIVAAYLVGSRGTLKHAAFLGAIVTFTHTISVFLLGLATLFLFQYVMPEKIVQVLGAVSGLSIVAIGGWMMYKRIRGLQPVPVHAHSHSHDHDHQHEHDHDHHHEHPHTHAHDHAHVHSHGALEHSHGPGGHVHSHAVPDEISWGSLIALGASGGLVPCESALVLLLSAIALGRVGLGLVLLVSFSVGLAIVLMGIGVLVLYAKKLIPQSKRPERHPAFRWIPVASAAVVMCVGLLMTGVSLGWLQPRWMI